MSASKASSSPIAVVGVSALFPGSLDATGFWRDILAGRDLIREVPPSHWLVEDYYDPDPSATDKTHAKRGAFLGEIDFDALAWGIPPSVLPTTDTSQLLALIVAQRVLEDASRGQFETMDRSRISVILGVTSSQELLGSMVSRLQRPVWVKALRESGMPENEVKTICDRIRDSYVPWKESTFPGLLGNVVAGRIANRLNLGGTNCVTDAACASTFSALAMGISELQIGDSDMVITGGVDTLNDIFMFMCFSKTQAMSLSGDCRPFSDQADGTLLGEGLGMVALKRLADAERDGDQIYAVIRGVGTSSDGRSKSVYAPVAEGQARALRRAYEKAGFSPRTVELVEAHGTGTKAGDAAEFEGLQTVFDESGREDRQWCALGSVKSQIGHTKAASGAAGLFKAVMAVHHKVLPPTLKIGRPNPKLGLESSPFYLNPIARPWIRGSEHPRRASVSSFGFGGSNFHVTLEEYTGDGARTGRLARLGRELVVLGAEDGAGLARLARQTAEAAEGPGALAWLARTTQADYDHTAGARMALVATDEADLVDKLAAAASRIDEHPDSPFILPDGSCYGIGAHQGGVAFLFPGQGSQYVGMGADLAMTFDRARAPWDRAADHDFDPDVSLHEVVFPRPGFTDDQAEQDQRRLQATEWAQPAIGCTSLSMLALVEELGLQANFAAGHSFGEITALHAAGVLSDTDMLRVARKRGELMAEAATISGAMIVVSRPIEEVRQLLARLASDVTIANHNGPEQVVLSGPTEDIEELEKRLRQDGIEPRRIAVATAFHSPVVAGSCQPFATFLSDIDFGHAAIPVFSNTTAEPHEPEPQTMRRTLADQIATPVRFLEMIENMYAAGARTFIEVGPNSVLTALTGRILGDRPHSAIALDRKGADGIDSLLQALAHMAAAGLPLKLDALWREYREIEDPHARETPRLAVPICGTNYGNPYPPAGGADELPPPNPPRPAVASTDAAAPIDEASMKPNPTHDFPVAPAAGPVTSLPDGWIEAFREAQRQTAEAHAVHQRAMAESHAAFLRAAETSFLGLSAMVGGQPATLPASVPSDSPARSATHDRPEAPLADLPMATASTMAPPPVPAPFTADAEPAQPVEPTPIPSQPAPAPPSADPPPAPTGSDPDIDLGALMLEIVAEKTGYPADMLEMGMRLEGDLGVDSIKYVEILATVQDRASGFLEVDTVHMSGLETLGDIVGYLKGLSQPSAEQTPEPTAASKDDLGALVLEIVAEKTGYPADMLEMGMGLKGDLGVDSIKYVEILAAVQDRVSGLQKLNKVHMSSLESLGAIVDYLESRREGAPSPLDPGEGETHQRTAPGTERPAPPPGRFSLSIVPAPATGFTQPGLLSGEEVWITSDGSSLNQELTTLLQERGVDARVTDSLPAGAHCGIFLGGLRQPTSTEEAIAVNREAFADARTLAQQLNAGKGLFVTVQDTGGAFGLTAIPEGHAWLAGLPALVKTAAQEWPLTSVKAIDIERGGRSSTELAAALAEELLAGGAEVEIGLSAAGDRRTVLSVPMDAEDDQGLAEMTRIIDEGDVVVVSGGARGVTAACIIAWAEESRARFVLLGRTRLQEEPECCAGIKDDAGLKKALLKEARAAGEESTPSTLGAMAHQVQANREIRATLAAVNATGGQAFYRSVDVGDHEALAEVLDRVRSDIGPISGVVHAAGVLADKPIRDKTDAQFNMVFNAKIEGLRALLAATDDDALKLICVFSSVAARCGNSGQADYAMANEILSKVAWHEARRRGPGTLVKSLCWGPWMGGMVTPSLQQRFEASGVPLIPIEVGATMFVEEMREARPEQVELVLGGEPKAGPLLGGELKSADERILELALKVDRTSHPYLGGHSINGTPVVPMVLVMEWFSRAARSFRPEMSLASIHDIQVLKGIRLEHFDSGGDRFVVVLKSSPGCDHLELRLDGANGTPHYRARLVPATTAAPPTAPAPDLGLERWNGSPVYGGVLFHQEPWQVIHALDGISDLGISGVLKGVRQAHWTDEPWQLDVAALDGGLQMALLLTERLLGEASLPTSISELRTFSSRPCDGLIHCVASRRHLGATGATTDIVLMDHEGNRIAELNGVQTHLLPSQS